MRRLLAILIPGLLLLTACGGTPAAPEPTSQSAGDTAKFDSLKLTDNGEKKAPGVEFSKPLEVAEPTVKVVTEGDGDRVKENQVANISILALSGADGSTLEDTFSGEPEPLELNEELKTGSPVIYNAFVGTKIGSSLALAIPGQAAAEGAAPQPTQLLLIKVLSTKDVEQPLEKPEGETVTPPAGLPTVKENEQGIPEISTAGAPAPTALVAQDLIKGKGKEVKATDQVVVNYVGVTHTDSAKFDSSYDSGKPATFPLNGVYKGWEQGLAGKTVGSRVLLVIPAALGNPDPSNGPQGDLVFVVDILGVK